MNVPRFLRRLFREPFDGLRHHEVVVPGVLYRSGQPRPEQLAELIEQHALKTIVCLRGVRGGDDPDAWEQAERAVCRAHGTELVAIPCNHKNPPTADQVEQFLSLMRDPARHPVLVHCRLGQQRTLLFCALYRVRIAGVSAEEAVREMDALGFNSRHRRHRRLFQAFQQFAVQSDSATTSGT